MKHAILLSLILFYFLSPTLAQTAEMGISVDVGYTDVINDDTPTAIEELDNTTALDYISQPGISSSPYHKENHLDCVQPVSMLTSALMFRPAVRMVCIKRWGFTPLLC